MPASKQLLIGSDNVLELNGLQDEISSTSQDSATVTVTLVLKSDGTDVVGESWPLTMSFVASSTGIYRATLSDSLTLAAATDYVAKVTANAGAGLLGYWELDCLAQKRLS